MLASIKPEGILCCINSRCLWVLIDLHNSAMSLRKQLPSFFEYPPCVSTYLWIDPSIHPSIHPSRHQYVTYVLSICAFYLFMLPIHISVYIYMCTYICAHIYIYICSGKNVSVCQREVSTPRMPMQQFLLAQIMTFFSPH